MRVIDIDQTPNQSFSVTIDGNRWGLTIKQAVSSMFADVTLNDVYLLRGQILVAGTPIIPYERMQANGNFILLTENDEMPNWERFGVDQTLVYATADEIAGARAS